MKKRDIDNRIKNLKQQLSLITSYRKYFDDLLGVKGTDNLIDEILDEIISLEKNLKNRNYE